jgi:prophage regulatory protein
MSQKNSIASTFGILPESGFVRLPTILQVDPISRSAWWQGVKDGRFPEGVKLGPRTTAWKVEHIRALINAKWASLTSTDTFDRYDDTIGGITWHGNEEHY